jgi:hypothetical protein
MRRATLLSPPVDPTAIATAFVVSTIADGLR